MDQISPARLSRYLKAHQKEMLWLVVMRSKMANRIARLILTDQPRSRVDWKSEKGGSKDDPLLLSLFHAMKFVKNGPVTPLVLISSSIFVYWQSLFHISGRYLILAYCSLGPKTWNRLWIARLLKIQNTEESIIYLSIKSINYNRI